MAGTNNDECSLLLLPERCFLKNGKGKPLQSTERKNVWNVYTRLREENPEDTITKIVDQTAKLTGVSRTTIYKIKAMASAGKSLITPGNKRPGAVGKRTRLSKYDEFTLSCIRKKVHSFFLRNEHPTVNELFSELNDDRDIFPKFVSKSTLRRTLKDLGFCFSTLKKNATLRQKLKDICFCLSTLEKNTSLVEQSDIDQPKIQQALAARIAAESCIGRKQTKINKENHHPSNGCTQSHDHSYVKNNLLEIKQFSHLISRSVENLLENKSANQKVDDIENEQNSQCQKNLKSTKEKFHRCNICGKKWLLLFNLFVHKYKFCKARLRRIILVKRVLKLRLSVKRKYQCNLCERNFLNESYLKWHLFMHIGKRPFSCKVCFKSFYVNSYLQNHKKIHTEGNIFQNKTCDRNLNFDSYLHDYEEHSGENELFCCHICRKTFQTEIALIGHGISHSTEKFHCDICNKNFRYMSTFEKHRVSHSEKRSFQCDFCEKTYKIHSKLTTHLRTHSEYKSFQCKV